MSSCWQGIYTLTTHICPVHEHTGCNLRAGGSSFHYTKLANICCFLVRVRCLKADRRCFFWLSFPKWTTWKSSNWICWCLEILSFATPVEESCMRTSISCRNMKQFNWKLHKTNREIIWIFLYGISSRMLVQTQMLQLSCFSSFVFFLNSQTWRRHRAFLGCFRCCSYSPLQTQHS